MQHPTPCSLSRRSARAFAIIGGGVLAGSWLYPGTVPSAIGAWVSALCYIMAATRSPTPIMSSLQYGSVAIGIAFCWLIHTLATFGGMPVAVASILYALFVITAALQFGITTWAANRLPSQLKTVGLHFPCAWLIGEIVIPRIFPWLLGHTQLPFTALALSAALAGAPFISFLMLWLAFGLVMAVIQKKVLPLALASFALIGALAFGFHHQRILAEATQGTISVSLVQANVSLERKHDLAYFETNVEEYLTLTNGLTGHADLVVWPETVIQKWIATGITSVFQSPYLPKLERPANLITGSLTFTPPDDAHNSALGILPSGEVLPPYHKQILMPFGEYMPGSTLFPWLKKLNENIADFTAGTGPVVFSMPLERESAVPLKVSPLICYEDVVPSLSRDAVRQGATLLVSVSNDAWFGESAAPAQHELIASFRAIENGRVLLRSTNTGATGIIDPTGKQLGTLPGFSAGVLTRDIPLLALETPYTRSNIGQLPLWLAWASLLWALLPRRLTGKL